MFVAQAALPFVGENRRLTRFGVSTAGLPTSSGACDSHAARRRDRNFNRGGPSIRGAYGGIADLASAAWRAATGLRFRAGRVRAAGISVTVGGRPPRGPGCRAGRMAAHADRPRGGAGRRGARSHGSVGASADERGARAVPRLGRARVDGGLRAPAWAVCAARVRRWVRIRSITAVCVMPAMIRIAPWHVGHASGATSKIC